MVSGLVFKGMDQRGRSAESGNSISLGNVFKLSFHKQSHQAVAHNTAQEISKQEDPNSGRKPKTPVQTCTQMIIHHKSQPIGSKVTVHPCTSNNQTVALHAFSKENSF